MLQLFNDIVNVLDDFDAIVRRDDAGNCVDVREVLDGLLLDGWQLNHPSAQIFIFRNSIKTSAIHLTQSFCRRCEGAQAAPSCRVQT